VAIESLIVLVNSCALSLLIGGSPLLLLLNWGSVVANNYALAQAHACGGSNCKGRGISQGL
jgi:hypothetical protein